MTSLINSVEILMRREAYIRPRYAVDDAHRVSDSGSGYLFRRVCFTKLGCRVPAQSRKSYCSYSYRPRDLCESLDRSTLFNIPSTHIVGDKHSNIFIRCNCQM